MSDVLLLLPGTGSGFAAETVAVFTSLPALSTDGALNVNVIAGAGPRASVGVVQVTTPEAKLQVQPAPVALVNVEPAGRGSGTTTDDALAGPLLTTRSGWLTGYEPKADRRRDAFATARWAGGPGRTT